MLADLLAQPEGRTLDFKREEVSPQKALRTLVAFANTAGGRLVLGVADDRAVPGVRDVKELEERYANVIASGISPPLLPDLIPLQENGKDVLVVKVPRQSGPFFVSAEGEAEGTYLRFGSTNRRADERQRDELRRLAAAQAFDERPCFGAVLADLDTAEIDRAFAPTGRVVSSGLLETLGIVVRSGGEIVPSNGGIILFGTPEARARQFGNARFRGARFLGTTKAVILDRFDEPLILIEALDVLPRFVQRNTRLAARIAGPRREDVPEYGPLALREVLANAAAHADFSHTGMTLNVFIYDDRVDVESPGGWPIGYSEEDFREGISRQRNKVISDVLRRLNLAEHLGTGFERIRAESTALGYPVPEWIEAGPVLRVRLRPHPSVQLPTDMADTETGTETDSVSQVSEGASAQERQRWFAEEIEAGNMPTAERLAEHFGVNIRTAWRDLAAMRDARRVAFEGTRGKGHYVLLKAKT